MATRREALGGGLALGLIGAAHAQERPAGMPLGADETSRITRKASAETDWFTAARYGMFVTWGLYAIPAGTWDGKRYYGASEWIMKRAKAPATRYKQLAARFDLTGFDAREWVATAKAAGFRYIIVTAKHHDGFELNASAASGFDIVDATPYRRDPLRALADETRKAGLKFGVYYSQFQDWTEANGGGNDWDFPEKRDFARYLADKALPQLTELLTRYGPISVIWFDTPLDMTKADAQALYDLVKRHQPGCLVSSRIGHGLGDYQNYRDSEIPQQPIDDKPWEAIFPHSDSWGYSELDHNYKSPTEIIRLLSESAGKGGNFLLSVGPDATGRLPSETAAAFTNVGRWLSVNGAAIYGTQTSPIGRLPFGNATAKDRTLYLHVLEAPESGRLVAPHIAAKVLDARLLGAGGQLVWRQSGERVEIDLPPRLPDPRASVVALTLDRPCPVARAAPTILSADYREATLGAAHAERTGGVEVEKLRFQTYFGVWKHFTSLKGIKGEPDSAAWAIDVAEPSAWRVSIDYAADATMAGREGWIGLAGAELPFQVLETGSYDFLRPAPLFSHEIGVVRFDRPGAHRLVLRPRDDAGELFRFAALRLTRHA